MPQRYHHRPDPVLPQTTTSSDSEPYPPPVAQTRDPARIVQRNPRPNGIGRSPSPYSAYLADYDYHSRYRHGRSLSYSPSPDGYRRQSPPPRQEDEREGDPPSAPQQPSTSRSQRHSPPRSPPSPSGIQNAHSDQTPPPAGIIPASDMPHPDVLPPPGQPAPPPEEHLPARPAWRTVPRSARRIRRPHLHQPPSPEPISEPPGQAHSWISWRPNPDLAPTPPSIDPASLAPEGSSGLFGTRSPRQPNGRSPSPDDDPPTRSGTAHSWITWQPNPDLAPTRLNIEPGGSPGLFGPRSPRQSYDRSPSPYDDHPTHPLPMSNGSAHSWVTWQSDPDLAPTPPSIEPTLLVPEGSPGLFGPRSPRQSNGRPPSLYDDPPMRPIPASNGSAHSWNTWQPNPDLAPTPPSIEPTLLVPGGSPGLFGPRSPRSTSPLREGDTGYWRDDILRRRRIHRRQSRDESPSSSSPSPSPIFLDRNSRSPSPSVEGDTSLWRDAQRPHHIHRRRSPNNSPSPSPSRIPLERNSRSPSPSVERDTSRRSEDVPRHRRIYRRRSFYDSPSPSPSRIPLERNSRSPTPSVERDTGRRSEDVPYRRRIHRRPQYRDSSLSPIPLERNSRSPTPSVEGDAGHRRGGRLGSFDFIRNGGPEDIHSETYDRPIRSLARSPREFSPDIPEAHPLPNPRPLSPTAQLRHDLHSVPPGEAYIAIFPSRDGRSRHRSPSVVDEEIDLNEGRGVRVPSRTGYVPTVIRQEYDHDRPPSEMPTHVRFEPTASAESDEALVQRNERLDDPEHELDQIVDDVNEAENHREDEFRPNENAQA